MINSNEVLIHFPGGYSNGKSWLIDILKKIQARWLNVCQQYLDITDLYKHVNVPDLFLWIVNQQACFDFLSIH